MQVTLSGGPAHGDTFEIFASCVPPYIDVEDADEDLLVVPEGGEAEPMPFSEHRYVHSDTESDPTGRARYQYWHKLPK